MNSHRLRPLIAWTLYACVLFNLLACGLTHSQITASAMSGASGQFCSLSPDAHPAPVKDLLGTHRSLKTGQESCPVCSGALIVLLMIFVLIWPRYTQVRLASIEPRFKAPPRYFWPSANPRASPQTLIA